MSREVSITMAPAKLTPTSPKLPGEGIQRINLHVPTKLVNELLALTADDPTVTLTEIVRRALRLYKKALDAKQHDERLFRTSARNLVAPENATLAEMDVD